MKLLVEIPDTTKIIADTENFNSFSYPVWVSSCINAIKNGQPLPEDCEILTKEAYSNSCKRASKGAEHWIDDADHYICPVCGFIVVDPNHFIGCKCPNCGFQDKKDKE